MKDCCQPSYFAPRTHQLTLGELRRMISNIKDVPDNFIIRNRASQPFEVFEKIQEIHGVEVFQTTSSVNLPID